MPAYTISSSIGELKIYYGALFGPQIKQKWTTDWWPLLFTIIPSFNVHVITLASQAFIQSGWNRWLQTKTVIISSISHGHRHIGQAGFCSEIHYK